jgi:L-alanine-DL-glutamate epimerase-like enolase superfamily enzyme
LQLQDARKENLLKITEVEIIHFRSDMTIHFGVIQYLWVRIHTDEGLVGLGETFPYAEAESAVIRHSLAPVLLGRNPLEVDRLWADMFLSISYSGWAGAEMRAISAIDIALWDLAGKIANVPIYQLLGGPSRSSIRLYNTCYDRIDFHKDPIGLAKELWESGIRAMKIWPFDPIAKATRGQFITPDQVREGTEPLRLIHEEFGDRMQVAMEFHGYWNLPCAIQIAQALEQYTPMWLEELLPQDNLACYRELASNTKLPLCVSERLMTRWGFREILESGAARIIMPDISWCGGISEAKKIASAAETYYLPVAPHNCGGPILHFASAHLAANVTNLYILESIRRRYLDEYRGMTTSELKPLNGELPLPPGPGLGTELSPDIFNHPGVKSERLTA